MATNFIADLFSSVSGGERGRFCQTLFDTIAKPAFLIDANTKRYISANRGAQDFLGFSQTEFDAMEMKDLHPSDDPASLLAEVTDRAQSSLQRAFSMKKKDGTLFDVTLNGHRFVLGDREIILLIVCQKRESEEAEQALEFLDKAALVLTDSLDPRETVSKIVELATGQFGGFAAIHLADHVGKLNLVAVNHENKEMLKDMSLATKLYPMHDDALTGPIHVFRSGHAEIISNLTAAHLAEYSKFPGQAEAYRRFGMRSYMCTPLIARGKSLGTMTFVSHDRKFTKDDLTLADLLARRFALALDNANLYRETLETAALLDTILTAAPVGVGYIDGKLRFQKLNKRLSKVLELCPEESLGKSFAELRPEIAGELETYCKQVLENGQAVLNKEIQLKSLASGERVLATYFYPIIVDTGRPVGVGLVAVDITETKQFEEHLQQSVKLRDDFVSIASHELRTPITSLRLQLQFIKHVLSKEGLITPRLERLSKTLSTADSQAERLSKLVQDLLDISRIRTGRLAMEYETVNLNELLEGLTDRLRADLETSGCTLKMLCQDHITGQWDRTRIEQILTNLLSNAMRYGAGKPIEVTCFVGGEFATVEVRDYGMGIKKEDQERIFNKFERAVSPTHYGGLGLGLYIVSNIVRVMGGDIRVESRVGEGAKFIVRLPLGHHFYQKPADKMIQPNDSAIFH